MDNDAKIRPFYMAKILFERTDEKHALTTEQLRAILLEEYGVHSHRQTIATEIELLKKFGMDIHVKHAKQNWYYVGKRTFATAELKLLVDAVSSSKFITAAKSRELIEKLGTLAGNYQAEELVRNIDVEDRIKTQNAKTEQIIDVVNRAITEGRKIRFCYFHYNEYIRKEYHNDGKPYCFSPYGLVWNGDHYYMVGWSDKHEKICQFRIDRIKGVPFILKEAAAKKPKGFRLNRYINTMFRMFDSERKEVVLRCDNDTMDSIVDRFGTKLEIKKRTKKTFDVKVETAVSNVFYGWVFGFGGKVKIVSPVEVKQKYREMVEKALK